MAKGVLRGELDSRAHSVVFRVASGLAVFAFAFFAAFASSSHFMPVSESSAEGSSSSNTSGTYYANITSSGTIDINIDATPDGIGKVGKDTLSIDTNATAGYKLYLSTASGAPNNGLYLESDPTKAITATTGTLSEPSKLATNTWGFAPSRANSSATPTTYTDADADTVTGSAVFAGVPEYGSENIIYTNTSPSTAGTNSVDVYFGVNASTALDSGEYSNTVVYTAIVDAVNPDTSTDSISVSPASQEGLSAGTPITIDTPLYSGFNLANLGNITVTIGGNNCTNITPSTGTSGNLTITCNSPAAATARKVDVVVTIEKYNKVWTLTQGYEYKNIIMQNFTCDQLPNVGDSMTLMDARDNKTYRVARLADNKCWMTEDLKLGGDSDMVLTPELSNVSQDFTLKAENTEDWCKENNANCDNRNLMIKTNAPNGYLYNWYTATAGTGIYNTGAETTMTASICPRGWTLPTGGSGGDFQILARAYGGSSEEAENNPVVRDALMASPAPNFNWTGTASMGEVFDTTGRATYWSRTAVNDIFGYRLFMFPDGYSTYTIGSAMPENKYYGLAVRCISTVDINGGYMQDFTASSPAAVAGKVVQLTDKRDNKKYTVAKLADNNWWMTSDLKLDGGRTLTSADSDVMNDFALAAENTGAWCLGYAEASCHNQSYMIKTGVPNGYLYNWYAATAGTGTHETEYTNASASVCPKGWKLPIGGNSSTDQFLALATHYGYNSNISDQSTTIDRMMATPIPAFNWTGVRDGGSTTNTTSVASYWASTASNVNNAYYLLFTNTGELGLGPHNKVYGRAVRCILK